MTLAAVIQMNTGADRARNLSRAAMLIAEAAAGGAELAVLPENFAFMAASDPERLAAAEPDGYWPDPGFSRARGCAVRNLAGWRNACVAG